ncbi:unnamed protein product [Amoebophrya sp. A25]|nr:unnamed protein product [Amoebophrya sp. A25]|eukprot:GSA25T00006107001.1
MSLQYTRRSCAFFGGVCMHLIVVIPAMVYLEIGKNTVARMQMRRAATGHMRVNEHGDDNYFAGRWRECVLSRGIYILQNLIVRLRHHFPVLVLHAFRFHQ